MTDPFDNPAAPGAGIKYEDLENRLLLITSHVQEKAIPTEFGDNDAIRADVVVLDGPTAGEEISDTLLFPRVLQGQLRPNIGTGRKNLGRLGKGVKKPGKNAPWLLTDPTDADKAIARAYLADNARAPF